VAKSQAPDEIGGPLEVPISVVTTTPDHSRRQLATGTTQGKNEARDG
jgi:hypothetical protein